MANTGTLPVFRAAGAKSAGTTGATTVSAPAGVAVGDLEILIAEVRNSDTCSVSSTGGGAWTAMTGTPVLVTGGETLYVWWRIRADGDGDPQVTPSADHVCAARLAYQAGTFNTSDPFDQETTGTETTSDTSFSFAPGYSTTEDNSLCLVISTILRDSNTASVPICTNANQSSRASRANYCTSNGAGGGFGVTEGTLATAGAVGTWACTYATASAKAYIAFSIRPGPIRHVNHWDGNATNKATLAVSPAAVGNLLVLGILVSRGGGADDPVVSVSGGGVTTWTKADRIARDGAFPSGQAELWYGVVTATGAATITVTYTNGALGVTYDLVCDEFSSILAGTWALDTHGTKQNASSTNVACPVLTSPSAPCFYYASMWVDNTGVAAVGTGSSGDQMTYSIDAWTAPYVYNPNLTYGRTETPVSSQTPAATSAGVGAIFRAQVPFGDHITTVQQAVARLEQP